MDIYEQGALRKLERWRKKVTKRPSIVKRLSKETQRKLHQLLPDKANQVVTKAMKQMVETILTGATYTTKELKEPLSLKEKEDMIQLKITQYKRTAAIEGAGTGAGGLFLGLADFPLLLSIKVKFLFEVATIYGFNVKEYEERLYILHIFQLAFSTDVRREDVLAIIESWDTEKERLKTLDWRIFQQEYRDYLDLVKLLQLIPGLGAIFGAYANYHMLEHLGEYAMNSYRIRILESEERK